MDVSNTDEEEEEDQPASPEPSVQRLSRQISNSVVQKKRARQGENEEQVEEEKIARANAKRMRGRSYTKKSNKTYALILQLILNRLRMRMTTLESLRQS